MCVCDLAHTTGVLLDCNQVRVLRQSLRLLRSRQLDVQDAILELCVDVFLLHIAHVETACAGAGEGFVPQIAALLILFVIAVAAGCHVFFRCRPVWHFSTVPFRVTIRKTKPGDFLEFYGTIGPACAQPETLQRMVEAGMTGIRMNLSHGPLSAHKDWLDIIHAVGIPQLLIDLQGPELRIGTLPQPLVLEPGQNLRLGQGGVPCPAALVQAARPGQNLLLDDGRLLVQVAEADGAALQCTVVRGGTLQSRKSLAAPGLTVASPTLTEEDLQNLQLAGACGVTGVMLPFVRGAEDIRTLRRALEQAGAGQIRIFAKIESLAGVQALPEFLPLVDEVVIARGDLGNAMPLWELPRCQKQLSAVCRSAGVPFMVVTQMLDSMCSRAVPTRAEVSDIYNAVADGASSVMLTGETAAGQYPVEAMEYLVRTARTALE